ncbi:ADL232Wp [Eremothecium gossypii ATCC 10895]|uniref:PRA1 family protein n=1 Tax=Eremothecium gossypii (strain ATCC 10895 / CBS 109.51 / FGSC 9923 / NRRL Y-1056) TaxID=284811 RepID=Q75B09_EREGS|nr:ADL232Wp [Eremothecium gossypii ATCC 10895]AAS51688.1 ADL232Wp [Eremothecium gossypii ATCC 10895]AEY95985.1 FADL232Wp [Eremothecium gossypii FDAG1]
MNYLSNISQASRLADSINVDRIKTELGSIPSRLSTMRPPREFFNVRRFSKPQNFGEVQSRVGYNLRYYSTNYTAIVILLFIYTLLTNLLLFFVIVFVVAGFTGINRLQGADLSTPFGPITTSQLYTGLIGIATVLGIFASPFSTLMWLVGISAVTIFSHASFLEKPIETVFEEETV